MGFRDTLEIGRERKYELYDIRIMKPAPLVPRHLRLEVPERIAVDGSVRTPLDEGAVLAAAGKLAAEGVTSLAIVFLHSYANPRHERQAAELLARRHPGLTLSTSIEVAPEIREYERVSTTVINAYIKPLAERYISSLAAQLAGRGIGAPLLLMLSPISAPATGASACWPSTWAAPPPSSQSSRTASPRSPTASRPRARSVSSRAVACRCASRRWS
jgi:N-methylhydantoinase A